MNGLLAILEHRGYIWRNAVNDLRYRYAGSGMGVFWNVVNPVLQIGVFGLVFSLFPSPPGETPAARWLSLCLGLVPWLGFSESLVRASHALVRGGGLVRINGVPLEVLVAESALASALSGLIGMGVVLLAAVLMGADLWPGLALILVATLSLHVVGFGLGLALACLRAFFADTSEVLRVGLQLWMWTMPIVYSEALVPESLRPWLILNPPWVYLREIRALSHGPASLNPIPILIMVGWAIATVALGRLVMNRLRADVLDVV